jgi:uncharacterized RDD family membrane protein YckC
VRVLPLGSLLASGCWLLNYLWPLWDQHRRAIHDKIAGTNVVRRL